MRIDRYKRFVESNRYDMLLEMLDGVVGFETIITDGTDSVVMMLSLNEEMVIGDFESLFLQISQIENYFPDVTFSDDGGYLKFEFHI